MDQIKSGWFTESSELWPGQAFSLEVEEVLCSKKSKYQDILLLKTKEFGNTLVLDGIIQCTERDEFAYQEMISFLPLCSHNNPEKVLIVGGGDGGVAREVAKHPLVKEIHQVEIDGDVVELSKKYLPFMAKGFDSPKMNLHIGDGFEFMKNHKNEFDVIITDSSDPIGPAVSLFQENYFSLMKEALKVDGIVCSQAGTIWNDLKLVKNTMEYCKKQFSNVKYAYASVPSYPSGQIGFLLGANVETIDFTKPVSSFTDSEVKQLKLKYYNHDIHSASFVLPSFVKSVI